MGLTRFLVATTSSSQKYASAAIRTRRYLRSVGHHACRYRLKHRSYEHLLHEFNPDDHDYGRKIEAPKVNRQMLTHPVEDRLGHRTQRPHDGIVRVRLHPAKQGGNDDDPEVDLQQSG